MQFPFWINSRHHKPLKRAQLRLKFMLNLAALHKYGRTSMHDLARDVGCNHSSIFNAINRGYFTPQMAECIERVVGADQLQAQWLTDPLEVGRVAA